MNKADSLSEYNSSTPEHAPDVNRLGVQAIQLAEQLQGELDAMRDQLAQSNRLGQLGMLTAALAHETNNLLTPIGSYAQLALANPDNAELTARALKAAMTGTKKAAKLVEGVMELAGPSQSIGTDPKTCQVAEVVDDAIACILPVIKQQHVHLQVSVAPACVGTDALALEQILINLIANSCQALSEIADNRKIVIESNELNERLILRVIDNGPGVRESIRDQIFEPFVTSACRQQEEANVPAIQSKGSGLGLSICKQIAEAAGGQLTLAESSGRGATFQIDLPIAASA